MVLEAMGQLMQGTQLHVSFAAAQLPQPLGVCSAGATQHRLLTILTSDSEGWTNRQAVNCIILRL